MFHHFTTPIGGITPPERFTWPFHYVPHALCRIAAQEVQAYIASREDWHEELTRGKMFGVLVVENSQKELGFLAAFSGNLAGSNLHEYFVPAVYDMLQPDDFFRREEAAISAINQRIKDIESSPEYRSRNEALSQRKESIEQNIVKKISLLKAEMEHLQNDGSDHLYAEWQSKISALNSSIQRLKAQLQREKRAISDEEQALREFITPLQAERHARSAELQQQLFSQFRMLNARGEEKDLCEIFAPTKQQTPPAGAGECAAPKLLQYAYLKGLTPLCMAEFWWGESPRGEVRQHGNFYPSCNSKCKPILLHMMQGLEVEDNPLEHIQPAEPEILWEDDYIVAINKPEGMLSVEGKSGVRSVEAWAKERYPHASGPMIVHRLDQSTSGILLIAKDKHSHKSLQEQFISHSIHKEYTALLEGVVAQQEGRIALPLKLDYEHRPRQMVAQDGRSAVTEYKVLSEANGRTLIRFYPLTGRTHQLRVHSAHAEGLGCPIVGDDIYGYGGKERLHLHASQIVFTHPYTSERITINSEPPFLKSLQ